MTKNQNDACSDVSDRDCLMSHDWCDGPDGETVDGEPFGGLCGDCYIKRSRETGTE